MGGCCFTPRKTQLLWWYWLLLFSVVGIPMFAAALYVQRAARHGVVESWQVRRASRIFWRGTFLAFVLIINIALAVRWGWLRAEWFWGLTAFVARFLFWLAMAVAAAKATENARPRYARLAVMTYCALIPAVLGWLPWAVVGTHPHYVAGLLPLGVLKFAVCMLPAHFWHRFTTAPSTKRAWLFLGMLAVGTLLFWVVSQYGDYLHAGLRHWLTGIGFYGP